MTEIKFIYSEKATKFCEISTLLLSDVVLVKGGDFAKLCGLLRIHELYFWGFTGNFWYLDFRSKVHKASSLRKQLNFPKMLFFLSLFQFLFCMLWLHKLYLGTSLIAFSFFKWVVLKGKFIYKYFAWSMVPTIKKAPTIFIWHYWLKK